MKKHLLLMLVLAVLVAALALTMVACNGTSDNTPPANNDGGDNTPSGDEGGNTSGDEGGNTPGDEGGNTPDDEGGNTPGDEGGNTPGDEGGNTPGDEGGNTPGDEGGNTPGDEGGDTPGDDPSEPAKTYDFTFTLVGNTYIITGVKEGVSEAVIPATYEGVAVTGIDAKALKGNTLTAFALDSDDKNANFKVVDGILYTADGKTLLAYPGGKTATSLKVNKNAVSIGAGAFAGNAALTSIDLNKVKEIGAEAFLDCALLDTITCGVNINICGKDAFLGTAFFANTENWTDGFLLLAGVNYQMSKRYLLVAVDTTVSGDITLNKNIWCIADYAFYENTAITSVNVDKALYSVGAYAFAGCVNMASFNFSACSPKDLNASYFGEGAFMNCKALTIFTVPFNLTKIYAHTFAGCDKMVNMVLCPNANSIDPSALTGTPIKAMYYYALETQTTEVDPIKGPVPELQLTSGFEWFYDEDGKTNDTRHKYWRFVDGIPTLWES